MMTDMMLIHACSHSLCNLRFRWRVALLCLCVSASSASGGDKDLEDDPVRFTGSAGAFLYVVNQGWNESPWLGSYVITI